MFEFSMSSLLMSVLFSNVLLILLYGIFRNTDFMMDIGHQLLAFFLGATLIRFLFPFELPFSIIIRMSQKFSYPAVFIKKYRFSIWVWDFSLWHVFLLLWLVGSIIGTCLLARSYRRFHKSIRVLGTEITGQDPYHTIIEQICAEKKRQNVFRVVEMPGLLTPLITGFFHPVILIPCDLKLDTMEWQFILSHETGHYFHHDLWLKLFTKLLSILYWWNPLILALCRQVSTMLELRIDRGITASIDPWERLRYMECLNYLAKQNKSSVTPLSISFCTVGTTYLLQRFHMIGDSDGHKRNRRKQVLISVIIIGVYLFSTFFIFEPYYVASEVAADSYKITMDNAYFIVNPTGGYDLYMEDQFVQTFYDPIDSSLCDLKIYLTKEEINHE